MNEHAYAEALKRLVESGSSPKEAVKAVHAALERRGRAALLPRIGRAFTRLAERARAKDGHVLYVSKESDARKAGKAASAFAKDADPEVRVDETLIGGWRLEGAGTLVDASFKKQLLSIYNRAVQK